MKLFFNNGCKFLCLIALAIVGYKLQPMIFSAQSGEVIAPEITELGTEIDAAGRAVQEKQTRIKPRSMQAKDFIPEIAEMEPGIMPIPDSDADSDTGARENKKSPINDAVLILVGKEASSTTERAKDVTLIKRACYYGEWAEYRNMLKRSISEAFENYESKLGRAKSRYESLWEEPHFYTALMRWKMLSIFPDEVTAQTSVLSGASEMVTWVLNNDQALEEMVLTVHQNDNKNAVFKFLSTVWGNKKFTHNNMDYNKGGAEKEAELVPKYFNLSLACATVFDKRLSYTNPSSGAPFVDGMLRYHWYRNKNEEGLLEGDIHKASAKDLTFVVCSPVSIDELEWGLREYRSSRRKNIGKAFSDVEYLMERAVNGLNPYATYTLQEILDKGGICTDQTYFSVNIARAAGIPAFGLSGITNSGGHAWASVKIKNDEWSTQIGRIAGVSEGQGSNPQSGEIITEQEVWHWSEPKIASRTHTIKVFRNLWIADFFTENYDTLESNEAVNVAHKVGQEFPITWKRLYQVMLTQEEYTTSPALPATLKAWKDYVKAMKHEFRKNPRMSELTATIEDLHIFPHSDIADVRRELARLRRRDMRNAEEQADLVTSSLKRETELLLQTSKDDSEHALEEVHQLYTRALREYGGSISGFHEMIQYYFSIMKESESRAKASVRTIELAFNRVVDTGSDDWFRKKTEVEIHSQIANMYREVGEVKRAANMEKRLERDMKNAKRKAL